MGASLRTTSLQPPLAASEYINKGHNPMGFKGPLGIPLANPFVNLIPAKFAISRFELPAPIGRGLVRVPLLRNPVLNKV